MKAFLLLEIELTLGIRSILVVLEIEFIVGMNLSFFLLLKTELLPGIESFLVTY